MSDPSYFFSIRHLTQIQIVTVYIFFPAILISIALMINRRVNYYYAKYVKQIKNMPDELKEMRRDKLLPVSDKLLSTRDDGKGIQILMTNYSF